MSEETRGPVAVGDKAAAEVKGLVDTIRHNNDQLNAFLAGARAVLGLPNDWRFDVGMMAFCPPPSQSQSEPAQGTPTQEA